jgi:ketosteroid isomerase-like protein
MRCIVTAFMLLIPAVSRGDDAADIRSVLDTQVACWNKGDLDGFMKTYWNSDELTFYSGGTVTKGWKPVMERYQKRYKAEGKEMGKLAFSGIDVVMVGEANAIVRGKWKLVLSKETDEGLYTLHLKKLPEGWRIVHDHTSVESKK